MTNMIRAIIATIVLLVSTVAQSQSLFVGTYNIRYENMNDSIAGDVWGVRSRVICNQINFEQPDVFGTQECLIGQLRDMTSMLDGYSYIGVAREDGKENGEHSAIFYKKDCIEVLENGTFWLSETPDRPSLGWDAACTRICTWGKMRDKRTGFTFHHFNLHMDHVGTTARREAAILVTKKIREIAGEDAPVILTGDFNVDQTDEIYSIFTDSGILKDSYECARLRFAENGTFNNFDSNVKDDSRIDHIFVSPIFEVMNYGVLTNSYWRDKRRMPSDHYPVFSRIRWK